MKSLFTRLQKFWSGMTIALMIVNPLFTFTPVAYASEGEQPEVAVEQATEPAPEESPETPAPSEAPVAEPSESPVADTPATDTPVADTPTPSEETPAPEVTPVAEETPVVVEEGVWQMLPNGKALTRGAVSMDKTYVAPQNSEVTVRFTELPDTPGNLTIQEIKLTAEEQDTLGALSDTAYDISSSMENGTFKYTLTLPKPENSKDVVVKYAETRSDLDDAKEVTQAIQEEAASITVNSLDHFTVFVISADTSATGGTGAYTAITGPTIVESALGQIGVGTIVLNAPAGFQFRTNLLSVTATVTTSGFCLLNQTKLAVPFLPQVVTPTASTITINVTGSSTLNSGCKSTITWSGIQVRPINGSPLAVGQITRTGTASVAGATFSGDTLQEVAGAVNNAASSLVASPTSVVADGVATSTITATVRDKFNNPISGQSITLTKTSGAGSPVIASSPTVTNASGQAVFTVKSTTVASNVFTASNGGVYTKTATVNFTDNVAPVITVPADITGVEATSAAGAVVVYTAPTALDAVSGVTPVTCDKNSGDTFPIGTTTVHCSSTDAALNTSNAQFDVTVVDTTAPVIFTLGDISVESTSALGATVTYLSPGTTDVVDGLGVATCSPVSGSTFAIGSTPVICNATDSHGNAAAPVTAFNVIVSDTTAPNTISAGIDSFWHNTDVSVMLSCIDQFGSGCATTYYTTDGSTPTTASTVYTGAFLLTSTGQYPIQYFSVDNVGNVEAVQNGGTVKIDKVTPAIPVIGGIISPTNNPVVSWTWSAIVDADSQLKHYQYMLRDAASNIIDSGFTTLTTYTTTLSLDGLYTFFLRAIDNAGNKGLGTTSEVTLDRVAPIQPVADVTGGNYYSYQTVSLQSSDVTSNPVTIYYTTNGIDPDSSNTEYTAPLAINGSVTLKAIAYDNAGNSSTIMTEVYVIAPIINESTVVSSANSNPSSERVFTWETDIPSSSRVVFGKTSVAGVTVPSADPNYGYTNTSDTVQTGIDKNTHHTVTIAGLQSNTTYYYRVISAEALENISSQEYSFGTEPTQGTGGSGGDSDDSDNSSTSTTSTTTSSQGRVLGAKTVATSTGSTGGAQTGTPVVLGSTTSRPIAQSGVGETTTASPTPTPSVSPEPSPSVSPEATVTPVPEAEQDNQMEWSWWYLLVIAIIIAMIWYFMRNRTPSV